MSADVQSEEGAGRKKYSRLAKDAIDLLFHYFNTVVMVTFDQFLRICDLTLKKQIVEN